MEQLRAATSECHRRLEKRLGVVQRFSARASYRAYLEVMFGFHAPFEASLDGHAVRGVLTDYPERLKVPLLTRDMVQLGATSQSIAALPRCARIPLCHDEAAALGSLYVLEGATLGGQVLMPLVERLQVDRQHGASYLGSYGAEVGAMWKRFGAVVEKWCEADRQRATAIAGAVATFELLETWLCGEPA